MGSRHAQILLVGILPILQMDLLFIQQTHFWESRKLIHLDICKISLPCTFFFFFYYNTVCNSKILSTTQVSVFEDCLDQLWYMKYSEKRKQKVLCIDRNFQGYH